jgi:TonB family protein
MGNMLGMLMDGGVAYVKGQVVLLPLVLAYVCLARGGLSLPHRQLFHGMLLALSVLLPVLLLIPMAGAVAPLVVSSVMMPALQVTAQVEHGLRRPVFTWMYLVSGICGLAGLAWLCIHLIRQVFVERRISTFVKRHRRVGRVSVILSPAVASSFTTGFFRPRIYLPTHLADDPQSRGVVLKHEFAHVRRGHLVWALIEQAYRRLFWFNPLSHFLFYDGRFVRELACDEAAARQCTPVTYAQVLVHQAEWLLTHRGLVLVNPLHENEGALKRRVTYLLEDSMKKTTIWSIGAILLSLAAGAGAYVVAGYSGVGNQPALAESGNASSEAVEFRADRMVRTQDKGQAATALLTGDVLLKDRHAVTSTDNILLAGNEPAPATSPAASAADPQPPAFTKGGEAQGARSRESIMKVVMAHLGEIRKAYNNRLREKPGIKGTITVKFAINAAGAIIFCQMVSSTLGDGALEQQVVANIRGWQFVSIDKPGDVTEVVYPFTFSQ